MTFSLLSLGLAVYLIITSKRRLTETKALTLLIATYGLISSGITITLYFLWHVHSFWRVIIHYHGANLHEIVLIDLGIIKIDFLSVAVVSLTLFFFVLSFMIGQISLHFMTRQFRKGSKNEESIGLQNKFPWLSNHNIIVIDQNKPDTFSYTLLHIRLFRLFIDDWIVISTGLIEILTTDELEAVLAHEYSHTFEQDTRYSHLVLTLGALLFFDPMLRIITNFMVKEHEFKADYQAAEFSQKPLALARSLHKLLEMNAVGKGRPFVNFTGNNKSLVLQRINRLIEYSETHNLSN